MIIIKNVNVYAPKPLGKKDIVIINNKIFCISENLSTLSIYSKDFKIIDGNNLIALPGIIDPHIHIAGAGGEDGFASRTQELSLNDLILNGITTCVGLLGTDGITRSMKNLFAKAKSLNESGLTTFLWSGSYQLPPQTLTGSIKQDIVFIDKIIGIGEIAISDHRGSNPTVQELIKIISETRMAGLLSGKCGVTHIHLGDGKSMLQDINAILNTTDIPSYNILPTHINRNSPLFKECVKYCKSGGYVDITTGIRPDNDDVVDPTDAFKTLLYEGCNIENITMSSDAGGSMPIFDDLGKLISITTSSPYTNLEVFKDLVKDNMDIETAISPFTSNTAKLLKFKDKGFIEEGYSGDIVLLDENFKLHSLIANGNLLVNNFKPTVEEKF